MVVTNENERDLTRLLFPENIEEYMCDYDDAHPDRAQKDHTEYERAVLDWYITQRPPLKLSMTVTGLEA